MIKSKLLKVKKWVDLNEAAARLSLAFSEHVNALDLMELALDEELILSIKLSQTKHYVVREIERRKIPYIAHLEDMLMFELVGTKEKHLSKESEEYKVIKTDFLQKEYLKYVETMTSLNAPEDKKTFDFFLNKTIYEYWHIVDDVFYLDGNVYELPMLGAERIDIMSLIDINREKKPEELYNLDGAFIRGTNGKYYIFMEKFDDDYIAKMKDENNRTPKRYLNNEHYFPAGGIPTGCEIGMSPANMSKFEAKLSEGDSSFSESQLLAVIGAVLKEITTSEAKKWTQGELATRIDNKKISSLSERTVNGIFSNANKALKSIN